VKGEILVLLHSHYPERMQVASLLESMSARSPGSIRNRLSELRTAKLLHGEPKRDIGLLKQGTQQLSPRYASFRLLNK
jgi:hypothetical protein